VRELERGRFEHIYSPACLFASAWAEQPVLWAAEPVPGSGQNWRFLGLENYLVVREGTTV
jgi:hypothetical protein